MRLRAICGAFVALALAITAPAAAEAPDQAFSDAHVAYMEAKVQELLAPTIAGGNYPSGEQFSQAWCRAAFFWKLANPGGEARLTMKVLLQFRRLQWACGQKIKRAPPLPEENDEDGTPPPPPPTDSDPGDKSQGGDGAVEDFMRWHPEEFTDADTETHYIERRIFWWEWMGEGGDLVEQAAGNYRAMMAAITDKDLERHMSPEAYEQYLKEMQKETDEANRAYLEAQAAEIAKAREEWRRMHPDEPGDFDGTLGDPVKPGEGAGRFYRDAEPEGPVYGVELEDLSPEAQAELRAWENRTADGSVDPLEGVVADRTAVGSVDPLDVQAWNEAAQPINVGPNSQVGSGAQVRDQVVGAIAGALGVNRGDDMDSGPPVESCRPPAMQSFADPQTGVTLEVSARRNGERVVVFARVAQSPDQGTFQTAFLQDQQGQRLAPRDVDICRLYAQWRVSVGWTRSTYQNGALTGRETGGWRQQGQGMIPGLPNGQGGQPDGLWRRMGFSNASRGAQMAALRFDVQPGQLNGQTCLIIHITRPGQNPVTTAPFVLRVREGPQGISFERVMAQPTG